MKNIATRIDSSISNLEKWIEAKGYRGYEPFDGLSSYLKTLAVNDSLAERALIQLVRQSPLNLRPLLGIKPNDSTKTRGFMASGYLSMLQRTKRAEYKEKTIDCLDWLISNKSPGYRDYCWGNHFDWSSRDGRLPKFEPTLVWTSLIGQTFLDAYELLGNRTYLEVAIRVNDWILSLPREETKTGVCLSYVAFNQSSIHNANLLGAAMLARTARYTANITALAIAKEAIRYSCSRQLANGAWYYGEASKHHWIDNFHTGYNLDSLKCYMDSTNDHEFDNNLHAGFRFLTSTFIEESGRPKYYYNRVYPVDIQCAAQAIDTLANFSEYDESSLILAGKVAEWTIAHMQDKRGYFYYRQMPGIKIKIPMMHWGQATMYKAMTHLTRKIWQHQADPHLPDGE